VADQPIDEVGLTGLGQHLSFPPGTTQASRNSRE
jgi:hypothetical protein